MSLEAGVLVDHGNRAIHWHLPKNRSAGYLPDSRDLWDVIWENRNRVLGFAHSHPDGCVQPSSEDLTTFAAVEKALGMRLVWWIVTRTTVMLVFWNENQLAYVGHTVVQDIQESYPWLYELREHSYSKGG